jgi:hypothetical protein
MENQTVERERSYPRCGRKVSIAAASCPYCGKVLFHAEGSIGGRIAYFLIILAVVILAWGIGVLPLTWAFLFVIAVWIFRIVRHGL